MNPLNKFYLSLVRNATEEGGGGTGAESLGGPPAGEQLGGNGGGDAAPESALSGGGELPKETSDPSDSQKQESEGSAAEAEAPAPFAADQLKLPEGVALPEEVSTAFAGLLNDDKLSPQERGQGLIDLFHEQAAKASEAYQQAATESWNTMNKEWRDAIVQLPEFKANPDAEMGAVKQALIAAGATGDFFSAMNLTGAGNNPHVLQILHKLVAPYREGGAISPGGKPSAQSNRLAAMYPTMSAKE